MVNVFSFCLYGKYNPKYYIGLEENIEIIKTKFPDFHIYIIVGNDIDKDKFNKIIHNFKEIKNKIHIIEANQTGSLLMLLRYVPIDYFGVDSVFSRDTDSRIGERDIWCIKKFLDSPYLIHTIRDHKGHFVKMMGGLSAIKKEFLKYIGKMTDYIPLYSNVQYNYDQFILGLYIYHNHRKLLLVHSTKNIFDDPNYECIPLQVNKETFCGQVIDYLVEDDNSLKPFFVYEYESYNSNASNE
jgi:hypothetical protein